MTNGLSPGLKNLLTTYEAKKSQIKTRLAEFRRNFLADGAKLFSELCFCLCTPQSKAVNCDRAIRRLEDAKILFNGTAGDIAKCLRGLVRFHNKKAEYIVMAREAFQKGSCFKIKDKINSFSETNELRQWLVKNIKGLGLKEASHFLRNIGLADGLAIIDRHILKNLKRYGAIKGIPRHISKRQYFLLEKKMSQFSKRAGIPLAELDLLFWSNQTGHIFK